MSRSFPPVSAAPLLLLVLSGLLTGPAVAADEPRSDKTEERRALRLEETTTQEQQSKELLEAARASRMDAISKLQGLLRDSPDGDRKAEMMLRLAYLYFEQGRADYNAEMEWFNNAFDQCFATATNSDECEAKIKEDHSKSYGWYDKSIKLYEAVLKGYPRYARADEATFYLGLTYKDEKREGEALEAFKKLVKLYPTSQFVPDGYVYIGEYYFDNNEAFPALSAYKKASSYTDHPRYAYAMYRLAWCYFNVDEIPKAIETMKAVVSFSMDQNSTGNKSSLKLEEEALKDLVRFFAEGGAMDEAYEYFTKLGKKELIRDTLRQLAALYFEQGKFTEAVETYRRLIQETPNHKDNPGYQKSIIDCYKKIGQKDRVIDELRRLREDYGKSSAWARANASDPDAIRDADDRIEVALRTSATEFNKEARDFQKAKHPRANEAFAAAVDAYKVYLEDFKDDKRSYNVHFDYAELLWDLKRYEEAYDEYLKVVSLDQKGEHSRYSAESAIFASEEMVKKEGGGQITTGEVKVTKDVQPIPLTAWEQRLIDSCKRYADLYGGTDDKLEVIIYKSAFLLYQRFHFTEAAEQFRSVISRWPNSTNAERSAKLILAALVVREEWVPLRDTAKSFWQTENLGSPAFKKEMYGIYQDASLDVINEDFKKSQDYSKTADAYMAFYKEFPDFKDIAAVLNEASVYFAKSNRVADAMAVRTLLVEDAAFGPKTPFYYDQIAALGYDYERIADFASAARYYDKLIALYPAEREKLVKQRDAEKDATKKGDLTTRIEKMDGQAADALYSTAVFTNALGDWQGGVERFLSFFKTFPSDERVMDLRLTVANIYEKRGEHDKAAQAFSDFYKVQYKDADLDRTFYARLHQGRNLLDEGKTAEATALYKESVEIYRKLKKAGTEPGAWSSYAGEMLFFLAKPVFDTYTKLDLQTAYPVTNGASGSALDALIKKDTKIIKDKLSEKVKSLAGVEKTYTEILDTGAGDWGMAALVQLGLAYEDMAKHLTSSACPFYLTTDQCDFYKMGLEDAAYPQSQKAVDVYVMALEKAYELNLYNENTATATRRLGEVRPAEFPGLQESLPTPGVTAEKTRSFDLETTRQ
ncbi:MAG TPA: tetratricopeptide repeat protein [Myxococcota bacterium]|nr:tetratricopeptide repeat protein [Myxococcota bacterium]